MNVFVGGLEKKIYLHAKKCLVLFTWEIIGV